MERYKRIIQIEKALEDRALVWFGPRGSDALGLGMFTNFLGGSFSLYDKHFEFDEFSDGKFFVALEDLTLKRRLSRTFDEDPDSRAGELRFRKRLEECFKSIHVNGKTPTVISYEPHPAVDVVVMQDGLTDALGADIHLFRRMSTKPLVEKELRKLGVPVIPWNPVSSFTQVLEMREANGGLIVRRDGGSSGKGIVAFRESDDEQVLGMQIREMLASHAAAVSFAPLFENAVSLNASAVVFPGSKEGNSKISTFPINAQLVGQPELTELEFGYSGNDFAFTGGLDNKILLQCDDILHKVGNYLASTGFVGAYGVDYLLTQDGQVLFTEVNARFQGSTRLLSRIAGRAGESDVLMEHLAATLGLPFKKGLTADQWTDAISPFSQMYIHNGTGEPVYLKEQSETDAKDKKRNKPVANNVSFEMTPQSGGISIEPGALIERLVVRGGVLSSDGRTLRDSAKQHFQPFASRYVTDSQLVQSAGVDLCGLGRDFGFAE